MNSYTIVYRNNVGQPIATFTERDWIRMEYTKREMEIGSLSIDLPPIYPIGYFQIDGRLEIYRSIGALPPYLECDTVWLVRVVRYKTDESGQRFIHVLAHDAIELLDRRVIAYANNTSYTTKSGAADDVLKSLVTENLGSSAAGIRNISSILSIDANTSLGATIKKEGVSYRKLFPLMQEIALDSINLGTYITFDIVRNSESTFAFRTWSGWRGTNRGITSAYPFIASIENGVLSYASASFDYNEERNVIYAGGQGTNNNRIVYTASDSKRYNISPLNVREDFVSADVTNLNAAKEEAQMRLADAAAKIAMNGHIQQSASSIYGLHYNFGDVIGMTYEGITMNVHLDTVSVRVDNAGLESITIYSRNLDDTEY